MFAYDPKRTRSAYLEEAMKGVVFLGDRKLELREFPVPTPGPRDVILEIKASGMCGSDLHMYRAPAQPGGAVAGGIKRQAGVIAGHEPCGVVAAVGMGVSEKEARVGERVMDHHYDGCGTCKHCRAGWTQMCLEGSVVYGSGGHGGHARYMKVPVSTLVPLPDALSFVTGAAISCGTGPAGGALRRLNLQGGETITIFGQGPVGLSATQLAVAMGARVIAVDIAAERRKLAQQFGAHEVLDPAVGDVVAAIRDLTHGEGAHKTLEASSAPNGRAAAVRGGGARGALVGHGLLCRRARPGDARREPGSPAPAGDSGRLLDLLEAGAGRVRRVRRGPPRGRGAALHAPLEARAGGGGLPALRYSDHGQGRYPAVLTLTGMRADDGRLLCSGSRPNSH